MHGLFLCLALVVPAEQDPPDFVQDVRPILERHCFRCHSSANARSSLRLDSPRGIRQGGNRGPVLKPGNSSESLLIRAVTLGIDGTRMPAQGQPLSKSEIDLLRRWIDSGAAMPKDESAGPEVQHWAFQPVRFVPPPHTAFTGWCRNPIDAFIAHRLERRGIAPSEEAGRRTLIRRVWLDVLGLLPDPEDVDAFVASKRPDAFERMLDRALASPHYGERWGRHWLDLARYADSHGYTIDGPRSIWPYRDWVIHALNENKPFDQFVIEQIAGDLLPGATRDQIVATGFHRNTLINQEGGTDPEEFRVKAIVDRVNTTGTVFLGLTIGCAQCHEHKYDPISQREYYELFAFFNSDDEPTLRLPTPDQEIRLRQLEGELVQLRSRLQQRQSAVRLAFLTAALWDSGGIFGALLTDLQARLVVGQFKGGAAADPILRELAKQVRQVEQERAGLLKKIPTTLVLRKRARPRETYVMIRGDFLRRGAKVEPSTPSVLPPLKPRGDRPDRLDLARWLVSPDNPLTPRVTVNRVWQRYFGRGIVETENDFGTQGARPSHPELLDWLAWTFVQSGWDLKRLHRLILSSATYRQRSDWRPELVEVDPTNKLLARQNRLRVEAEVIRDISLCAAGLLTYRIGGPGVYPPQPEGIYRFTQVKKPWPESKGADRYRRGLYIYFWRSSPYPFLITFDAPRATTTCTRRVRSNTPLQALMLANDIVFIEAARALAARSFRVCDGSPEALARAMFRFALCRPPDDYELNQLVEFFVSQAEEFRSDPQAATLFAGELPRGDLDLPQAAAAVATARVILNLDEFITRE